MSRNSSTPSRAFLAFSLSTCTTCPSATVVTHAGISLGAFSTSTRHMRHTRLLGGLDDRGALGHREGHAVDRDIDQLVGHRSPCVAPAAAPHASSPRSAGAGPRPHPRGGGAGAGLRGLRVALVDVI